MKISLKQYKEHLINCYRYEIDNTQEKREVRKQLLEKKYKDEFLSEVINNTYLFIKEVLDEADLESEHAYHQIPIEEDTTLYISLNLVGGYHSDTLYRDNKGRMISRYIIKQFFGDYFFIDIKEEEREVETDNDILSFDYDYYIYMQNFPKNIQRYKREINLITQKSINAISLGFDDTPAVLDDHKNYEEAEAERTLAKENEIRRLVLKRRDD